MIWLIRFSGDLTTKHKSTRRRFQDRLIHNLEDALRSCALAYRLERGWSRLYLDSPDPRVPEVLARVFGIASFSPVHVFPLTTLEDLVAQGRELFAAAVRDKTYAVRARRAGGRVPFSSMDVQVALGAALNPGARVDLDRPQVEVHVEIRNERVYFFSERHPGPGGLPLGVEGRALALVSGGFDSAVAAWMALKRGVTLDYVFFRLGGPAHERDARRVLEVLARDWSYGTRPQLYVVPFEPVVERIQERVATRYWQLVLKRQMYRAAGRLARRGGHHGLVTGEALGQVSSQTLKNLEALQPTEGPPLLRPLLGFDKQEIVDLARRIGTATASAGTPEYCALVPEKPATAARAAELDAQERALELDLEPLLETVRPLDLRRAGRAAAAEALPYLVRELPEDEDAVLLDVRTEREFRRGHHPRALHLEFVYALDGFEKLDPSKTYYVYCALGLKSANLVERMRKAGYRAFVYLPADEPTR